jgi:signal transduction histidine kinase
MTSLSAPSEPSPSEQVETTLFRALIVLRLVVTAYALVLNIVRFDEFRRPAFVVAAMVLMVAWTGFASWAYDAPRRRCNALFVADLAVAVLLMLVTPLVQSQEMLDRNASTLPSFWVVTSVLAWAVGKHWVGAVVAAAVVSVADIAVRVEVLGSTWGNIFLLLLAAGVVGYTTGILREAAELRAAAERAAAVQAERTRLARVVHDGVLQVLALVQRRGAAADGEMAELGRLAGEQEAALRALVQYDARSLSVLESGAAGFATGGATGGSTGTGRDPHRRVDLMAALERLQSAHVTLTGPGRRVELTADRAEELVAVVSACLDNVRRHVGELAPAWVFVDDLGDAVLVSVRDEGPGIAEGRLAEAADEGRLGVRSSICGRMSDLGGRAELVTGPGLGTEWELTLPRAAGA